MLVILSKVDHFSPGVMILLSIVTIIVTVALMILIFYLIRKNIKKLKAEQDTITEQALSRTAMRESVEYYIAKVGNFGVFSMMSIEIDDYSGLVELIGTDKANKILAEIANRIANLLPYKASISLYKADQFLVFIKDNYEKEELEDLAKEINKVITDPFSILRDEDLIITGSIGIASYPACGTTFNDLVTNLELATYVSKRAGGNCYTSYYSQLSEVESANLEYFKEVRDAIKNKEFCLYYQPIVNIKDNTLFAFECLLRWSHPVHGILPPFKFINILEQSGDIKWVGQWGIEQIAKQISLFKARYPEKTIKLSLNLSTKQLIDTNLAEDFRKITKKYRVNNNDIILEIAEFAMYDKMLQVKTNLLRLKDYGFIIAVDGFGLDYSTLSQITNEPIDIIKLDRYWSEEIENNFIKEKYVGMLVDFAKKNNQLVVSEGVENKEVMEYVLKNGIDYAQGYYFSKPMSEDDLNAYIDDEKWKNPDPFTIEDTSKQLADDSEETSN